MKHGRKLHRHQGRHMLKPLPLKLLAYEIILKECEKYTLHENKFALRCQIV